jgi:predicted kinase
MNQPYFFVMFGLIGSGKSYFARQLAEKDKIIWLNSDALLGEIYEDPANVPDGFLRHHVVFSAMRYAAAQALKAGKSVIYDANNNKSRKRRELYGFARQLDARPVLVHVDTPEQIARQRILTREVGGHIAEVKEEHFKSHMKAQQLPEPDEPVVTINGQADFEGQYQEFRKQLGKIQ